MKYLHIQKPDLDCLLIFWGRDCIFPSVQTDFHRNVGCDFAASRPTAFSK